MYKRQAEKRVPHDLPDAEFLHHKFVELLKGIRSYHKSYKAAFRYSMREYVPKLEHRTLITCAENDLVRPDYEEARMLLDGAESCITPGVRSEEDAAKTAAAFAQFLLGN